MKTELKAKNSGGGRLSLEKVSLDWLNTKTQLIVGLILIAVLMILNFSSALATDLAGGSILDSHLANLLLYIGCVFLIALLALDITGRFGNRFGAAPAIWAAALFSVYPLNVNLVGSIVSRQAELNCFFMLLAVFGLIRWVLLKETIYLGLCLAGCFLLGMTGVHGLILIFASLTQPIPRQLSSWLSALLFPVYGKDIPAVCVIALTGAYIVLGILAITRILLRITRPEIFVGLLGCLTLVMFLSTQMPASSKSPLVLPGLFYGTIPLCLLLSFMAMPAMDSAKLALTRVMAGVGVAALSLIFLVWSFLLHY